MQAPGFLLIQQRLASASAVVAAAAAVAVIAEERAVVSAAAEDENKKDYPCAIVVHHSFLPPFVLHQHNMAKGQNRLLQKERAYKNKFCEKGSKSQKKGAWVSKEKIFLKIGGKTKSGK